MHKPLTDEERACVCAPPVKTSYGSSMKRLFSEYDAVAKTVKPTTQSVIEVLPDAIDEEAATWGWVCEEYWDVQHLNLFERELDKALSDSGECTMLGGVRASAMRDQVRRIKAVCVSKGNLQENGTCKVSVPYSVRSCGRIYPVKTSAGASASTASMLVRERCLMGEDGGTLAVVDVRNAMPITLYGRFVKAGMPAPRLGTYVTKRDSLLGWLASETNVDAALAKRHVLAVINGAGESHCFINGCDFSNPAVTWMTLLRQEMRRNVTQYWTHVAGRPGAPAAWALYFQSETTIMMRIAGIALAFGVKVVAFTFDGCVVSWPKHTFNDIEQWVGATLGPRVTALMDHDVSFSCNPL